MPKQSQGHCSQRGHTVATHTWSHPRDLSKLPLEEAKVEMEKGFVAASYVLGQSIAPFFRYPGLNHSPELNAYLASRNISVWSVDVVSGDTAAGMTPELLVNNTIDPAAADARRHRAVPRPQGGNGAGLDAFLTQVKLEGFKIVHVVSNTGYQASPDLVARMDFSKKSLTTVAFTGVGTADPAANPEDAKHILATGQVDYMKNEFVDLESASKKSPVREVAETR